MIRALIAVLTCAFIVVVPAQAQEEPPQCATPNLVFKPETQPLVPRDVATGAGVRVAVIDTGVARHPELGEVIDGGDFLTPNTPDAFFDCDGHGTVVAGLIASSSVGVAPGTQIISIRQSSAYVDAQTDVGSSVQTLADGIHRALDHGARVINISVVACIDPEVAVDSRPLDDALLRAEASGTVIVAAAGNTSSTCHDRSVVYPTSAPTVLGVGARDTVHSVADYSLPGFDASYPGAVPVALSSTGQGWADAMITPQGQHTPFQGTSFAAPIVAGTAAFILEREPHLSPAEVRERLISAAEPAHGAFEPARAVTALPHTPTVPREIAVVPSSHEESTTATRGLYAAGGLGVLLLFVVAVTSVTSPTGPRRRK